MKQKVLKCWQGKKAEPIVVKRVTQSEQETMIRDYGRAQCRTTHKRKDC